jgi:hypothetical protein
LFLKHLLISSYAQQILTVTSWINLCCCFRRAQQELVWEGLDSSTGLQSGRSVTFYALKTQYPRSKMVRRKMQVWIRSLMLYHIREGGRVNLDPWFQICISSFKLHTIRFKKFKSP